MAKDFCDADMQKKRWRMDWAVRNGVAHEQKVAAKKTLVSCFTPWHIVGFELWRESAGT